MKLNTWQILGLVLILAGVFYAIYQRSRPATTEPTLPSLTPTISTQPA